MVLKPAFTCPTLIVSGHSFTEAVAELLEARPWTLVTSVGWTVRGAVTALRRACGEPRSVIADVAPNPTASAVLRLARAAPATPVLVALGGGSVIDCAKAITAIWALDGDSEPMSFRFPVSHCTRLLSNVKTTERAGGRSPTPTIARRR